MAKHPGAVALGKLGGKAKSPKKTAAVRRNMAKARKSRWPKKPLDINNRLL